MDDLKRDIEQHMAGEDKKKISNWPAFVEGEVIHFLNKHGIEKLTLDDGNGNKAKLTRGKNDEIKVELSSVSIF